MTLIGVALAGGLGALARYHVEGVIATRQRTPFPLSTLVVNVTGSALFGGLVGVGVGGSLGEEVVSWVGVGFLGGFTTFSTFTYETVRLIEDGAWRYAAWNVVLAGPLTFAAAAAGYLLAS